MIKSGYSQEDLARMGPDELTKRRLLAEALLSDASKQRKIEHPLQGMAQMAKALLLKAMQRSGQRTDPTKAIEWMIQRSDPYLALLYDLRFEQAAHYTFYHRDASE